MDRHFLEFWGNFLLNAAKGQKHLEDLTKWLNQGFFNFQELTTLFQKAYGLDQLEQGSPDYLQAWKKAEEEFRKSLRDYLKLLEVVPRSEYLALAGKHEELEKKVAQQEETIKHLKMLLKGKGMGFDAAALEFQELIKSQGDQFQEVLKGLGEGLKPKRQGK